MQKSNKIWRKGAFSIKNKFLPIKSLEALQLESFWVFLGGIKHSTSIWVLTQKPVFLLNSKFATSLHFQLFSTKNAENDSFDQRLGCAAPKHWSKYTTKSCGTPRIIQGS